MKDIIVERLKTIAERHEVKRVLDAYKTVYDGRRHATPLMKKVYLAAAIRQSGTELSIDDVSKHLDQLIKRGQFPAAYAVKEDLIEGISDGVGRPSDEEDEEKPNRLDKFKKKKKSGFKSFVKKGKKPSEDEDQDDGDEDDEAPKDGKKPKVERDKGDDEDESQFQSKRSEPEDRDETGQARGVPRKKDEEDAAEEDAAAVTTSRTEIVDKKNPSENADDEDDEDEDLTKGKTLIRINPKETTDIIRTEWLQMMRAKRNR